jgi:hypothetical protein
MTYQMTAATSLIFDGLRGRRRDGCFSSELGTELVVNDPKESH